MKQILVIMAVVLVVGCSNDARKAEPLPAPHTPEDKPKTAQAAEAEAVLVNIVDPILEECVRFFSEKPTGELTEADLEKVTFLDLTLHDLEDTQITDEGLKGLAKLQNIEKLYLWNTQITDEGLKEVAKLQKLEWLYLGGTKVTDAGLKELAKLQKLEMISLNGTQITDAGLKELAKRQKWVGLELNETKVTDEGLKELTKLQKLFYLGFLGTKVTKAGVAELKKALPNCQIEGP